MAMKTQKEKALFKEEFQSKIPLDGKSRWEQLRHFIPVSRETWRKLCKAGKAPQPERVSLRCTVYDNAQIHLWLSNPSAYRA